jgi:hypothetical protein
MPGVATGVMTTAAGGPRSHWSATYADLARRLGRHGRRDESSARVPDHAMLTSSGWPVAVGDSGAGEGLPDLRQVVVGDGDLDLSAVGLAGNDDPVALHEPGW